jgi:RNA 3'-phosphate cyclase
MLPLLEKMGYHASLTLIRRGHYPKGGGKVTITIKPCKCLMPITLLRQGEVVEVSGLSHSVRLPPHVAERQAKAAEEFLTRYKFPRPRIDLETFKASTDPHIAPGSGITLFARCSSNAILGADCVGERGKPAEQVGLEAAQKLLKEVKSNMPVDRHMGDMLVPYMAVADGLSTIAVSELTLHTLTNVKIAEIISGVKFEIEGELGNPGKLSVKGIGLKS